MIFGYEKKELEKLNALCTASEIMQQPELWSETYRLVVQNETDIRSFLKKHVTKDAKVIFTGAGSSDYIGDTIVNYLSHKMNVRMEAIATTDIVSNPEEYVEEDTKTVLVSFARSGNSPESVGAYNLFQDHVKDIVQVIITCNKEGELAKQAEMEKDNFVFLLPDKTNDKGFAMTSSLSCMMLAALLFFDIDHLKENKKYIDIIIEQGKEILENQWQEIKNLSTYPVQRLVYLGAGCFHGLIQELALKNMELTNGRIATIQESILGFRHGPKTFMDDKTNIIVLMSQDDYTNLYCKDLIREIHHDNGNHRLTVFSYKDERSLVNTCDTYITVAGKQIPDNYACFNYLLYGQLLGFFNSLELGITPDNPSPDGTVNRVVKGVTIHNYV